jgi:hypothetical protein
MSRLKQPTKQKLLTGVECTGQCLKTIENQAWPLPLKKGERQSL